MNYSPNQSSANQAAQQGWIAVAFVCVSSALVFSVALLSPRSSGSQSIGQTGSGQISGPTSGWSAETYKGIKIQFQTAQDKQGGEAIVDYLLSKDPFATDSRRLGHIRMKADLRNPATGTPVGGYTYPGSRNINVASNFQTADIQNNAAHELGHVVRGVSESAADAYAGIPHDFSRWNGLPATP